MRRILLVLLAAVLGVSAVPASAHRQMIQSPENPDAGRLDVESVEVQHPRGLIRFLITFRDPHRLRDEGGHVRINFNPKASFRRHVLLERNPDDSLYGTVNNRRGRIIGLARAWVPDDHTLAIELHRHQLRRPSLAPRMNWMVQLTFLHPDCPIAEDIPGACTERVPQTGVARHRF